MNPPSSQLKRVALVVPNDCDPDYRVVKQAEYLARCGHEVRVYCVMKAGLPPIEVINGVTYRRLDWQVGKGVRQWLGFMTRSDDEIIRARRSKLMRKYRRYFGRRESGPVG